MARKTRGEIDYAKSQPGPNARILSAIQLSGAETRRLAHIVTADKAGRDAPRVKLLTLDQSCEFERNRQIRVVALHRRGPWLSHRCTIQST